MFFKIYAPKVLPRYEGMKDQLIPYLVYYGMCTIETCRLNGNAELK